MIADNNKEIRPPGRLTRNLPTLNISQFFGHLEG